MSAAHLALLRAARALIEDESEHYICYALSTAAENEDDKESYLAAEQLRQRIMKELDCRHNLGVWLAWKVCNCSDEQWHNWCYLARLAWLDKLIEEYRNAQNQ